MRRCLATFLMLLVACGNRGPAGEIRSAFEKGDFKDAVAVGRHALRQGQMDPGARYYYGLALVALGRDSEGFAEVDSAVAGDAGLKPRAAAALEDLARRDGISAGDRAHRMRKAHELDRAVELGRARFDVADTYYEERDFAHASAMYDEAVNKFPDDPACERAYARLAECLGAMGDADQAREVMEALVQRYPHSGEAQGATAHLNESLYEDAQRHLDAGDYDQAIATATDLVGKADNRALQQKARFLLGQAYEAKGDRAAAYEAYREVIRSDRGDSGQVVEKARSRIEALQEAGLR